MAELVKRLLLSGLDQALNQGWMIKGDCHDDPSFEQVRRVRLFPPAEDKPSVMGFGCTIEEALYVADRAFRNPKYQIPRLEDIAAKAEPQLSASLDRWIWSEGSFTGRRLNHEVKIAILFGSEKYFCHDGRGESFVRALDQAFPGEGEIIYECITNYIGLEIIPGSVPLCLSRNRRRIIHCSE